MTEINAMIRHMRAKGIDCHVILEAVEALSEAKNEAIEERRAAAQVRRTHLLAPGLHRGADAVRESDAQVGLHDDQTGRSGRARQLDPPLLDSRVA